MKRAKQRNSDKVWRNSTAALNGQPMIWRRFGKKIVIKSSITIINETV